MIGPKVTTQRSCFDCEVCVSESYRVQSDSGQDVYCTYPSLAERKRIGDTNWETPDWCPAAIAASPQFIAPEVTDEMCISVGEEFSRINAVNCGKLVTPSIRTSRSMIAAVRAELGPNLGLVELREPSDEECARICSAEMKAHPMQSLPRIRGRAMFESVSKWIKGEL